MALIIKDRVKEITTSTGTGAVSLEGTSATFDTFQSVMSNGDTTFYAIVHTASATDEWEVGLGTWNTGNTLTRTTVYAGSSGTSAVNFSSGNKDVFMTYPAGKAAVTGEDVTFADITVTGTVDGRDVATDGTKLDTIETNADVTDTTNVSAAGALMKSGGTMTGNLILNADPTTALGAATKEYVDTIAAAGIHYHTPVRVESPSALTATYNNGSSGVGATLTNSGTQAALVIDGVTLATSDRVLVYNQSNAAHNGIYTVTNTGSASTNWVLTRATDADSYAPSDPDAMGEGDAYFVKEGDTGAGELYVMNTSGTITFGTTAINFTVIAETAVYSAGNSLTLTGTTFDTIQDIQTSASPTFAGATVNGNITVTGTVDGRDVAADGTKLDGIEANADVTDTANVTAAGALMDSEVANLAQVKAFDSADYATAAQGTTADNALPKAGGTMTGNIVMSSTETVDGRDLSVDGAKLDGIESGATADQTASEILTAIKTVDGSASGLDADLLDGQQGSYYLNTSTSFSGDVSGTYNAIVVANDSHTHDTRYLQLTGGTFADNAVIKFGSDEDLRIYHSGSFGLIDNSSSSNTPLIIGNNGNDQQIRIRTKKTGEATTTNIFITDEATGEAQLLHLGDEKLATKSTGIDVTGIVTDDGATHDGDVTFTGASYNALWDKSDNALEFADNAKAVFGTDSDFELYHNGSHLFLYNNTGSNYFRSNRYAFSNTSGTLMANMYSGGQVELYHSGSEKFRTTSSGIDVTGNIAVSGTVDGRDVATDGTKLDGIEDSADVTDATNVAAAGAAMTTGATFTGAVGVDANFDVKNNRFTVDSSTGNTFVLGSLTASGTIYANNGATFGDNDKAIFGAGSDLQIYHNANNSYVQDVGTGKLHITSDGTGVSIDKGTSELMATFDTDGAVTLYYDSAAKLATTSTGIDVTGNITVSGTVDGRDVATDGTKLDGIEAGATADQTASEILTAIKTVDGSGSGLDADLLDGNHASAFLTGNQTITLSGDLSGSGTTSIDAQLASNVVGAAELNVTGNGTTSQFLRSDGDGTFTWATPEGSIPSGTVMLFAQTAAPTGWTKSTAHDNKALRVVSGTTSSGGSVDFTTAFASQAINGSIGNTTAGGSIGNTTAGGSVGSTTLTTSTIPSHRHTRIQAGGVLEVGENTPFNTAYCRSIHYRGGNDFTASPFMTNYTGSSGSHNHSFSGTAHNHSFSGTAHNHSFSGTAVDLAVQYVDVIIATKN